MRESSARTSTSTVGPKSRAQIEDELRRLPGVRAAAIERAPDGRLGRVHVTSDPDWTMDTVRRDVEAMLQHRFNLLVPPQLLEVRELVPEQRPPTDDGDEASAEDASTTPATEHDEDAPMADASHRRLVLDTVHLALRTQGTSIAVDLLHGDERLRGTAGPVGPKGVLEGVVAATLDALRPNLSIDLSPVVAQTVEAGGDQLAIATLSAIDGRSRQQLTGSALVRGNVEDAMARATLDATNRLLQR